MATFDEIISQGIKQTPTGGAPTGSSFDDVIKSGLGSSSFDNTIKQGTTSISKGQKPFVEKEGIFQSIFKAPIELGKDISRASTDFKEAKASEERLRSMVEAIKNSNLPDDRAKQLFANVIDDQFPLDNLDKPKTKTQIAGDLLGTALFVLPVGQIFQGLRGASIISQVGRGAVAGGAFGAAEAIGEGDDLGDFIKKTAIGAVAGGVFEPLAIGAVKGVGAIGKKVVQKTKGVAGPILEKSPNLTKFISSVGNRLETHYGADGAQVKNRLLAADRETQLRVGQATDNLKKAKLFDLTDQQAWKAPDSLLNKMQGKSAVISSSAEKAFTVADDLRKAIALEAKNKGILVRVLGKKFTFSKIQEAIKKGTLTKSQVKQFKLGGKGAKEVPFQAREDYFPHFTPHVDKLRSGKLRSDVIENSVNQGAFKNLDEATDAINKYLEFVDTNGRSNKSFWSNYLVKTGQAQSKDEAVGMMTRFFKQARQPRFGPLESAREFDFPFYDPDPRRVLPQYTYGAVSRLETIAAFDGKDPNKFFSQLVGKVSRLKGPEAGKEFAKLIDIAVGKVESLPARDKFSQFMRTLQIPKLAFSQVLNLGQSLNTLLSTDATSTLRGIAYAFTQKGQSRALQTGATLESVFREAHKATGIDTEFGEKFLRGIGFTATERFNRTVAANTGFVYAEKTLAKLVKDPSNKVLKRRLTEMGIDADSALRRGTLVDEEKLMAGQMVAEMTQFRQRPLDLPAFAASPEGKMFFQFKNFAFQQTRFLKNRLKAQIDDGNYSGVARDLIVLGTLFPMTGEVIGDIRSIISGTDRPTGAFDRYMQDLTMVGGFGIIADAFTSASWGRVLEFLAGPGVSTATQLTEKTAAAIKRGNISEGDQKFLLAQTGFGRAIGNYLYPSNRAEQEKFIETLSDSF